MLTTEGARIVVNIEKGSFECAEHHSSLQVSFHSKTLLLCAGQAELLYLKTEILWYVKCRLVSTYQYFWGKNRHVS
jgi:hypothetical protein